MRPVEGYIMLKFLIIFAAWITPGIVLFLYLLWISKRHQRQNVQLQLPLTESANPTAAENNAQRRQTNKSIDSARSHLSKRPVTRVIGL
jgi:hypothetical protein